MASTLAVIDAGPLSTIQDRGRLGYQRFGISESGAMDLQSFRVANALLGNDENAAVIEMTLAGISLRVISGRCHMAYVGAPATISVDGIAIEPCTGFIAEHAATITIGAMRNGLRGYLAVEGGVLSEPVLGSRATHTRSNIGGLDGGALHAGQQISVGTPDDQIICRGIAPDRLPSHLGPVRVLLGPQSDLFTAEGIATFLSSEYRLSSKVDRMGCQLEGARIEHSGDFNIVSDGIVNGSIQVPGTGQPIILLADRQTTGGYAKIATVIGPDLRKVAQARPGEVLRFEPVDAAAAERIARENEQQIQDIIATIRRREATDLPIPPDLWGTIDLLGGVAR
jgi:biotin-dependent carboxylase-like uncharacterized protein